MCVYVYVRVSVCVCAKSDIDSVGEQMSRIREEVRVGEQKDCRTVWRSEV